MSLNLLGPCNRHKKSSETSREEFKELFDMAFLDELAAELQDKSIVNAFPAKVSNTKNKELDLLEMLKAFHYISKESYVPWESENTRRMFVDMERFARILYPKDALPYPTRTELRRFFETMKLFLIIINPYSRVCWEKRCVPCNGTKNKRESIVTDLAMRFIRARVDQCKAEMDRELLRVSPKWNPEWLNFTWIFTSEVIDKLDFALQFASDVAATMVNDWLFKSSIGRKLPRELILKIKEFLNIARHDLRGLPQNSSSNTRKNGLFPLAHCKKCKKDCPMSGCCKAVLSDSSGWKYQIVHVESPYAHSDDCSCQVPVLTESDYMSRLANEAQDPWGIMEEASEWESSQPVLEIWQIR